MGASYSCVGTLTLAWAFLDYSVGIFWCKLLLDKDKVKGSLVDLKREDIF